MSQLINLFERFTKRVTQLSKCCVRTEQKRDTLRVIDVELIYSSSFLAACALWEGFLEDTLFEVVCGQDSRKIGNAKLVIFKNRRSLERVLLHPGKNYIGIENLKRAEELATLFIANGRPFSAVGEINRSHLQQCVWIRNAIAHQSSYAVGVFREKVPGVAALPRPKQLPGAFLRHEFRVAPTQRRYELYFASFQSAAREIAEVW